MNSQMKNNAMKTVENTVDSAASKTADLAGTVRQELDGMGRSIGNTAAEAVANVGDRLKSVGVDTDAMTSAAKEHASDLQKMLAEELRTRPLRALGVAAAIGVVVGLMTAR